MIKLNILNMKEFLKTVNGCAGAVNVIHSDGKKENINQQDDLQEALKLRYSDNKNYLRLELDIPNSKDYLRIVYFSIGDC